MSTITSRRKNRRRGGSSSTALPGSGAVFIMSEILTVTIGRTGDGLRLDRALTLAAQEAAFDCDVPRLSRTRIRALIEDGRICASGAPDQSLNPSKVARESEQFQISLPAMAPSPLAPESIPLQVVHEDSELLVVDKPAGMVVHPAPGVSGGTLVNALLAHGDGRLSGIGHPWRPGIVHRTDRGTSGLLVVAKTDRAHADLADCFARHEAGREYLAISWGVPSRSDPRVANLKGVSFEPGGWIRIQLNIGVHPTQRTRMTVLPGRGRSAITRLRVDQTAGPISGPTVALLKCRLETGRTHQIRAHLSHLGHPLVGDKTYGRVRTVSPQALNQEARDALTRFDRPALHAVRLSFPHPLTGKLMNFSSEPPKDFRSLARQLSMPLSH